jgi:phosphoribosylformylglycinamidine synthase
VGLIEDAAKTPDPWFKGDGRRGVPARRDQRRAGGSEFVQVIHGRAAGRPPALHVWAEKRLHGLVLEAVGLGLLRSAHDPSDGGLAVALAECAFRGEDIGLGGSFDLPEGQRPDMLLFSESASRMVVTTRDEAALMGLARRHSVPAFRLGQVGGDRLALRAGSTPLVDLPVARLHQAWMSLEPLLQTGAPR